MIKERFSLKLDNLIFLILLSFSLLYFWGEVRLFMKPVLLFIVGLLGLIFFSKVKSPFSTILTNLVIQLFVLLVLLKFYFKWDIKLFSYVYLLALFLFYKIALAFLTTNRNSIIKVLIRGYIVIIGVEILFFCIVIFFFFVKVLSKCEHFFYTYCSAIIVYYSLLKKIQPGFYKRHKTS